MSTQIVLLSLCPGSLNVTTLQGVEKVSCAARVGDCTLLHDGALRATVPLFVRLRLHLYSVAAEL